MLKNLKVVGIVLTELPEQPIKKIVCSCGKEMILIDKVNRDWVCVHCGHRRT